MLTRIFGNSGKVAGSEPAIDEYDVVEDLSSWEFVIPSDEDDDHEAYSFNDDEDDDVEIAMKSDDTVGEIVLKQDDSCLVGSPSSDVSMGSPSPPQITAPLGLNDYGNDHGYGSGHDLDEDEEEEEDDDDYDDEDYGLDDELVPYRASNKFANQRMEKLSKMISKPPRMNKPKRIYYYNKPGSSWKIR